MRTPSLLFVLLLAILLSACGFHLRGQAGMPFATLYLDAANPRTAFIADLRRNLEANNVKLVNSAEQADVVLNIVSEIPGKQILTLGGSGRVNEFQLFYRVSLRAYDLKQQDWIATEEIVLRRDYLYDDTKILAKEAEETLLYQSMRSDMVQQIVRRLSRAKPQPQ
ncbi:MAG TPA: LPS assembly lipoprotein LptE [Gallionella sp.]|jgi:LPS-assembly lipoprotein|nr:LPS assembly lipoprotein LptE [Gallionella sp.]